MSHIVQEHRGVKYIELHNFFKLIVCLLRNAVSFDPYEFKTNSLNSFIQNCFGGTSVPFTRQLEEDFPPLTLSWDLGYLGSVSPTR